MLNKSTSRSEYVVQSGVTPYPIGFTFQYNGDDTPQIRVTIGDMVAVENLHFIISEDLLTIKLIPLEEEAPADPNDYSWLEKWVGMPLVIERDIPFVQESDYQLGRISPERIEKDFDLSVMRDQILADKIGKHAEEVQVEVDALHSRIDFVQEEHFLDMASVDKVMATKATKAELENAKTILGEGIQDNTDAIQKTREDYLPLTGGILTGPLGFSGESDFGTTGTTLPILRFNVTAPDGSVLEKTISVSPNRFMFFDGLQFHGVRGIRPVADISSNLGSPDEVWKFLFVNKIRNGSGGVLNVPEDGGTLARVEDIDAIGGDGTKGQVLTKTDTGLAWTDAAGGGGIADVVHDDTMNGSGTDVAPLGVNTDVIATKQFVREIDDENVSGMHDYLENYIWPEINTLKSDKQDKLTAGENITINEDGVISAAGGGGSGDYLPLSGGKLTGALSFDVTGGSYTFVPVIVNADGRALVSAFSDSTGKTNGVVVKINELRVDELKSAKIGGAYDAVQHIYVEKIGSGKGSDLLKVPDGTGTLARVEDIDAIGGDGTTGQVLTKTDTGIAWTTVSGGGGTTLPDQTGNAGAFLQTDGTEVKWNKDIKIGSMGVSIGENAQQFSQGVSIGYRASTNFGIGAICIGKDTSGSALGVAIGTGAKTTADNAIQIGCGVTYLQGWTNSDANTFKVGNKNGNFEMMSADGTIPAERMSAVAGTTGQVLTKTDTGMAWADASGGYDDIDCGVMS